jgi:endoribonuclease Dicer
VLDRSSSDSAAILQWMDAFHRSPRVPPPPQKLKSSSRTYLSDDEDETDEENRESYLVHPTTSGRIYPQEATTVLISLVSHLREELPFPEGQSLFDFQLVKGKKTQGSQFTCSINLPGTDVDGITGSAVQSIYLARRSASFEACKRLLAMGVLDHRMVPLPSSLVPHVHGLENLEGAKVAGTRRYPVKQPDFWGKGNTGPVSILYPTVLALESHQTQYSPIVLLTRQPLPPLMEFNLFASGNRVVVRSFRGAPFEVDDDQMEKIRGFSMRVFRSFLNKPLNCALENMTYFLAPLVSWQMKDAHGLTLPQLESSLDWALMGQATDSWIVPIRHGSAEEIEEDLADAVIQDRWIEFTRRYHVVKVRADMSPLSKPEPTEVRHIFTCEA